MAASASGARSPTAKAGPTVGETALPFTFTALLCYLAFILEMLVVPDVTINLCTNMFVPFVVTLHHFLCSLHENQFYKALSRFVCL